MHELSIAEALIEQLRRCTSPGTSVAKANVEIGPRQSVDESSLRFAWEAITAETDFRHTRLDVTLLPWNLTCNSCKSTWKNDDPLQLCPVCGSDQTRADGSSILRLQSIELSTEPLPAEQYL